MASFQVREPTSAADNEAPAVAYQQPSLVPQQQVFQASGGYQSPQNYPSTSQVQNQQILLPPAASARPSIAARNRKTCEVCGQTDRRPTSSFLQNIVTCEACKKFLERCQKQKKFKLHCKSGGRRGLKCNLNTERPCAKCRLDKAIQLVAKRKSGNGSTSSSSAGSFGDVLSALTENDDQAMQTQKNSEDAPGGRQGNQARTNSLNAYFEKCSQTNTIQTVKKLQLKVQLLKYLKKSPNNAPTTPTSNSEDFPEIEEDNNQVTQVPTEPSSESVLKCDNSDKINGQFGEMPRPATSSPQIALSGPRRLSHSPVSCPPLSWVPNNQLQTDVNGYVCLSDSTPGSCSYMLDASQPMAHQVAQHQQQQQQVQVMRQTYFVDSNSPLQTQQVEQLQMHRAFALPLSPTVHTNIRNEYILQQIMRADSELTVKKYRCDASYLKQKGIPNEETEFWKLVSWCIDDIAFANLPFATQLAGSLQGISHIDMCRLVENSYALMFYAQTGLPTSRLDVVSAFGMLFTKMRIAWKEIDELMGHTREIVTAIREWKPSATEFAFLLSMIFCNAVPRSKMHDPATAVQLQHLTEMVMSAANAHLCQIHGLHVAQIRFQQLQAIVAAVIKQREARRHALSCFYQRHPSLARQTVHPVVELVCRQFRDQWGIDYCAVQLPCYPPPINYQLRRGVDEFTDSIMSNL